MNEDEKKKFDEMENERQAKWNELEMLNKELIDLSNNKPSLGEDLDANIEVLEEYDKKQKDLLTKIRKAKDKISRITDKQVKFVHDAEIAKENRNLELAEEKRKLDEKLSPLIDISNQINNLKEKQKDYEVRLRENLIKYNVRKDESLKFVINSLSIEINNIKEQIENLTSEYQRIVHEEILNDKKETLNVGPNIDLTKDDSVFVVPNFNEGKEEVNQKLEDTKGSSMFAVPTLDEEKQIEVEEEVNKNLEETKDNSMFAVHTLDEEKDKFSFDIPLMPENNDKGEEVPFDFSKAIDFPSDEELKKIEETAFDSEEPKHIKSKEKVSPDKAKKHRKKKYSLKEIIILIGIFLTNPFAAIASIPFAIKQINKGLFDMKPKKFIELVENEAGKILNKVDTKIEKIYEKKDAEDEEVRGKSL